MNKKIKNNIILVLLISLFLSSCKSDKEKSEIIPKKNEPVNMKERILGRGDDAGIFSSVRSSMKNAGTTYEFATSNPLWRATLESLKDMPIATANYSGGLLVTDWINSSKKNQSYKIQVSFKSNELATSSLEVQTFLKTCNNLQESCSVSTVSGGTSEEIKIKILGKARQFKIEQEKNKKK